MNRRAVMGITAIGVALPILGGCGSGRSSAPGPGNPYGSSAYLSLADAQSDALDTAGGWMADHHNTGWGTNREPSCIRLSRAAFRCVVVVYLDNGRKYVRVTARIAMGPSFLGGGPDIPYEDVVGVHRFQSR